MEEMFLLCEFPSGHDSQGRDLEPAVNRIRKKIDTLLLRLKFKIKSSIELCYYLNKYVYKTKKLYSGLIGKIIQI